MKKLIALTLLLAFGVANAENVQDFTGYYDCANWTATTDTGYIECTEDYVFQMGNDSETFSNSDTSVLIAANAHSQISFDWEYLSEDVDGPSFDPFGYMINGVFTQLTDNFGDAYQWGSAGFEVFTGDIFGFVLQTVDGVLGPGLSLVYNFSAVPEPGTLALLGIGLLGFGVARKKKA